MHSLRSLFGRLWRQAEEPVPRCRKALDALNAQTVREGRRRAEVVLARAQRCPCCQSMLAHVFDRLGSTLFTDDDPRALLAAFPPAERDGFGARVLAALILLQGRPRVPGPAPA